MVSHYIKSSHITSYRTKHYLIVRHIVRALRSGPYTLCVPYGMGCFVLSSSFCRQYLQTYFKKTPIYQRPFSLRSLLKCQDYSFPKKSSEKLFHVYVHPCQRNIYRTATQNTHFLPSPVDIVYNILMVWHQIFLHRLIPTKSCSFCGLWANWRSFILKPGRM